MDCTSKRKDKAAGRLHGRKTKGPSLADELQTVTKVPSIEPKSTHLGLHSNVDKRKGKQSQLKIKLFSEKKNWGGRGRWRRVGKQKPTVLSQLRRNTLAEKQNGEMQKLVMDLNTERGKS